MARMRKPVDEMITEVSDLLADRMKARGNDLTARLRHVRRRLPRRLRAEADRLAEAEGMAGHPRLSHQLDHERLAEAHAALVRHLAPMGATDRRIGWILSILASIAFNLLAVFVLLVAVLIWRGLL
jgi:hypothetical protein